MMMRVGLYLALISTVVVIGSLAGSWWLAGGALRPVREIIDQAEEIEARSLPRGITAYAETTEYQRLVQVLDSMLTRLQDAFESQRRFTADASHELRSPLTAMRGELELALRRDRDAEEYQRVIASTLEETVRLSRTAEDLLTLARSDAGAVKPRTAVVDIAQVVRRTTERLRTRAGEARVTLVDESIGDTIIAVDPDLVDRAVWNLVDNALRFAPEASRVVVTARGGDDTVILEVRDEGPGLGDIQPQLVFERFFRADASRTHADEGGTGLGLAIVKAIAEAHGGSVSAENLPGGGARFALSLPRVHLVT